MKRPRTSAEAGHQQARGDRRHRRARRHRAGQGAVRGRPPDRRRHAGAGARSAPALRARCRRPHRADQRPPRRRPRDPAARPDLDQRVGPRARSPLIIVDGAIMNVGSLEELGGLDIESIEVVKGAAGASLYGTRAANGVITIRTKRGATQDGVQVQRPDRVRLQRPEQRQLRPADQPPPAARRDRQAVLRAGLGNSQPCSRSSTR